MKLNTVFISPIQPSYNIKKKTNLHNYENFVKENKLNLKFSDIVFRGQANLTLLSKYKILAEKSKIPAIESFLSLNASKEELENLAISILRDEKLSFNFIKSLVEHPRKIKYYYEDLRKKLDANSLFFNVYSPTNEYKIAYEKYIERRVNESQSISELLKIRPDWREDFLLKKHQELYHNNNFELGFVPNHIGAENFNIIMEYLNQYKDYGFKTKQDIPDLNINDKIFKFQKLIDGRSDKNVFLITMADNKKYIIKTTDPEQKGLNKPFAIGTCCIIDQYLTMNNCRNSAPLRYYNHNTNTAIYDFIEHETTDKIATLKGFIDYMPDFSDLGLYHSDTIGTNNYFKLSNSQQTMKNTYDFNYGVEHGEFISVDNDHVTYNLALSPMVDKYHKYLPTGMQMFN